MLMRGMEQGQARRSTYFEQGDKVKIHSVESFGKQAKENRMRPHDILKRSY